MEKLQSEVNLMHNYRERHENIERFHPTRVREWLISYACVRRNHHYPTLVHKSPWCIHRVTCNDQWIGIFLVF